MSGYFLFNKTIYTHNPLVFYSVKSSTMFPYLVDRVCALIHTAAKQ